MLDAPEPKNVGMPECDLFTTEFDVVLHSELALSNDWNRPEEVAAWAHLQTER